MHLLCRSAPTQLTAAAATDWMLTSWTRTREGHSHFLQYLESLINVTWPGICVPTIM
jgi:hypothetical protein